ncbi:MAG: hypothetical protein GY953_50745, partial [bacterium]|nr:hypothetical protein [bacterium]
MVDDQGRAIFGTGNEGKIYRLDSDLAHTQLLNVAPTQVTALGHGRSGKIYAATGNVGKVYQIGPQLETEGSYEGDVLDARYFSYWGRLNFRADGDTGTVSVQTRSGNLDRPQQNWSSWSPVEVEGDSGRVTAPPARFLQYKVTIKASSAAPAVDRVEVAYLHKNVAPVIRKIAVTPANYRFAPQVTTIAKPRNLTLPPLGASRSSPPKRATTSVTQSMQYAKGSIGARWLSEDNNRDS